jgi:hypothetical protein
MSGGEIFRLGSSGGRGGLVMDQKQAARFSMSEVETVYLTTLREARIVSFWISEIAEERGLFLLHVKGIFGGTCSFSATSQVDLKH